MKHCINISFGLLPIHLKKSGRIKIRDNLVKEFKYFSVNKLYM